MTLINIIGNVCIGLSLGGSVLGIAVAHRRPALARALAYLNFFAITLASLAMVYALLTNDFSVSYVAHVGAKETPRFFAAISLWSSLEGSILLWGWVLSAYTALCLYIYRNSFEKLMPWVTITLFCIAVFFYLILILPANPFHTVFPVPENGPGPNPLLQNHWLMGFHPPMLYLGYVGFSVPFAFAVASLMVKDSDQAWLGVTRRWTLAAWGFLSAAIVLGAWWSYAVLGWGGYWAWDPVENASFMPWLTATPLIHSIMVESRRGMLKVWNLCLIVTTFLLTLLGTFLTRSGVLDSVHAFTESEIGHYFLAGIGIALMISVALLIWRGPHFRSQGKLDSPLSRETVFFINNLLFLCFCAVVFIGTLYPLLAEAVRGVKVTVGQPFFNQMSLPLAVAIILLMGLGVAIPWGQASARAILKLLRLPALTAVAATAGVAAAGGRNGWVLAVIVSTVFSLAIMLFEMVRVTKQNRSFVKMFRAHPRRYGGFVTHIGIIFIAVGIAFSAAYPREHEFTLKPGETFVMKPYQLRLADLMGVPKPQRFEVMALMSVSKNGKPVGLLMPSLNFYSNNREPIGSPAVRSTWKEDLYLTLMAFEHKDQQATLRVLLKPAVSWIWIGGGVIVLGVLISLGFRREKPSEVG